MSTQGPNAAGTGSGYTNSGNITADDSSYATALVTLASPSVLSATNFGFSIPSGATINGVTATVKRKVNSTTGTPHSQIVQLIKGGTAQGNNNADTGVTLPTTEGTVTYGSGSDMWGLTLTDTDVNASNFGLKYTAIRASGKVAPTLSINYITITIDYTSASGQPGSCRMGGIKHAASNFQRGKNVKGW